jgi:hypothetical protein
MPECLPVTVVSSGQYTGAIRAAGGIAWPTPQISKESGDSIVMWLPEGPIVPGWETVKPILLNVERDDDGEYIVTDDFSTVYGNGRSATKAKKDYGLSLIEHYEFLASLAGSNVHAALALARLSRFVRRTS